MRELKNKKKHEKKEERKKAKMMMTMTMTMTKMKESTHTKCIHKRGSFSVVVSKIMIRREERKKNTRKNK